MIRILREVLPTHVWQSTDKLTEAQKNAAEEIRLRLGQCPSAVLPEGEVTLPDSVPVTFEMLRELIERATGASPYAFRDSVANGFLSCRGGIRIGICGDIREDGASGVTRTVSSAAVRIPHEILGCSEGLVDGKPCSTLIISPPGLGKTTLLRDMIRAISEKGIRVGVADDRGELAAFSENSFGFTIGRCTDVITHRKKALAVLMLLRSMNPQVIAMDEITEAEDGEACRSAANCGVVLLASAHASSLRDLRTKPLYQRLLSEKLFERVVVISRSDGTRSFRCEAIT